ncbi:G-type lectin S-receptor-like serine/threonine-protein kinase At5g35370 [Typha angustifolia]|uniref:G-type lectin S-receptor-like serine/threonine-protein kinase At5g35370 n=1 Tax=Typha angustifolia TaxID=59011 RepID=UPI003C2AD9FB
METITRREEKNPTVALSEKSTLPKTSSNPRHPYHHHLLLSSPHGLNSHAPMPCSLLLLLHLLLLQFHFHLSFSGNVSTEFLYPPFTASSLLYIDSGGVFLVSRNSFFQAAVYKPGAQQSRFYLAVLHVPSKTLIWAANRAAPMVDTSGYVRLSSAGLSVSHSNGTSIWSTPGFSSSVSSLQLLDSGNLLLRDATNATLWQSFEHPADTLVSSQSLFVGSYISSSTSDTDLAESDYRMTVTSGDAVLTWIGSKYWQLSNDNRSVKDRNAAVASMSANATGLYLFSPQGSVVFQVLLPLAEFRVVKLGSDGRLQITSYSSLNSSSALGNEFVAPSGGCDLPVLCGSLSLCTARGNKSSCACPALFAPSSNGGCLPAQGSVLASSSSCENSATAEYLSLGSGIAYFANKFAAPVTAGQGSSACQSLCSGNCSCLGYFFDRSSKSCYLLEHQLGSLYNTNASEITDALGYLKIVSSGSPPESSNDSSRSHHILPILLPSIAAFLLIIVVSFIAFAWLKNSKKKRKKMKRSKSMIMKEIQLGRQKSPARRTPSNVDSDDDDDDTGEILIPGLPTRFDYAELEAVTDNFHTKIGSGGFGSVYKGELPDKSLVAVKKIEVPGVQGKKEFCTEIAVIGNIRHVNLVRLRGFCAQGSRRMLVYEYMNRGSLEKSLFARTGPALEWGERIEIAVGAARGLAYLHSGCDHKIVHCDVKPENILLADGGQVKISDFGLAKLMAPEQSGLITTMRGTRGYLAPEWLTNTAISDRTDVYSFGMVLLEVVRGRKNRGDRYAATNNSDWTSGGGSGSGQGSEYFPMVALERHEEGRYAELADPRMEGRVREEEVERVVKVALCCLHEEPALRPSMVAVVGMLEGNMEVWEPRVESLNFLRLYGRGFVANSAAAGGTNRLFGNGGDNITRSVTSSTTTTSGSPSYVSSQQLSGPR